jgi:hypothetical protein
VNPFARPYSCDRCRDSRTLTRHTTARKADLVPCDKCGLLSPEEYDRFTKDAWMKNHTAPGICELDLTEVELAVFRVIRREHPGLSKTTVLSYIEGQRYEPSKDAAFTEEARMKFREWRKRA